MNARIMKSLTLIAKARSLAADKDVCGAIKAYAEAFYLRNVDEGFLDIEYSTFYRYQFRTYLIGKKTLTVSLPEGDMISDLIRSTYEDMRISMDNSPFNIAECDTWNLLKEVHIDFPCQYETLSDDRKKTVSF